MTDTPTPDALPSDHIVATGGFCVPVSPLIAGLDLFRPHQVPGNLAELALEWDDNATDAQEAAGHYLANGRRNRADRMVQEALAWRGVAAELRAVDPTERDLVADWDRFSRTQGTKIAGLTRKTPARRRARAQAHVYYRAALELRICLAGGGPLPTFQLPVITAERGSIHYVLPPAKPCDCGSTDIHELGTGPYCQALTEYEHS